MDQLKIVALIGTPVHLNYFVNRIVQDHQLALVIRENSRSNLLKKILEKGILKSVSIIVRHFMQRNKIRAGYERVLGDQWQEMNSDIPLQTVEDINSPEVVALLNKIKPDLVIVQGTTLIRNKTLQGIPLVLNLHWGLSPYYKGSNCTEWAMINKDINNIGFTIHKISSKIDGGDIVTQGRPEIELSDTANSINMKLTRAGAAAMSQVIARIKNNVPLEFATQDTSSGQLFLTKHWTGQQAKALRKAEATMPEIMKASGAKKPIITMKD